MRDLADSSTAQDRSRADRGTTTIAAASGASAVAAAAAAATTVTAVTSGSNSSSLSGLSCRVRFVSCLLGGSQIGQRRLLFGCQVLGILLSLDRLLVISAFKKNIVNL